MKHKQKSLKFLKEINWLLLSENETQIEIEKLITSHKKLTIIQCNFN